MIEDMLAFITLYNDQYDHAETSENFYMKTSHRSSEFSRYSSKEDFNSEVSRFKKARVEDKYAGFHDRRIVHEKDHVISKKAFPSSLRELKEVGKNGKNDTRAPL